MVNQKPPIVSPFKLTKGGIEDGCQTESFDNKYARWKSKFPYGQPQSVESNKKKKYAKWASNFPNGKPQSVESRLNKNKYARWEKFSRWETVVYRWRL
jgi:hypothetical protein